jgi:serine O-acetyltransferase
MLGRHRGAITLAIDLPITWRDPEAAACRHLVTLASTSAEPQSAAASMMMSFRDDVRSIRTRDPAARTSLEVVLTYPGFHAVVAYRAAAWLHHRHRRLLARTVSHLGRFFTGIEIHPGATIGRRLFIDHGMGVVIGETSIIGDDVTLYQGVTLGGTGKERGKRHPTLENGVVVGVGAKILGAVTIGTGAKIGAGAVTLRDVPPHTTAVGVPARAVAWVDPHSGERSRVEHLPDPEQDRMVALLRRIEDLEQRLHDLDTSTRPAEHPEALV